jgi:AsmA family protein
MWRRWLLAFGLVLLTGLLLQPLWLAPLVGRHLTHSSGRPVHFDRMWVSLSSSLQPVVQWRGVRIDNVPWADSRRPFAALASATAVLSWRSIEQRRPVIELMVLRDGEVDLERGADGLRNWRLANPEYRGPGRYKVLALQAERASLRFRHEGADLDLRATATPIDGTGDGAGSPLPTRVEIEGEWRRLPFKISAATGPTLTFLETGQMFPLRGFVTAGGARLDVDGQIGDIVREPLADARIVLAAPSLAPLAAFIESPRRDPRAIRIVGVVKASGGNYDLAVSEARIGATDLAGEFGWKRGELRSAVRARLKSDSADLADLRWLTALRRAARAVAPAAIASAASAPGAGFELARRIDADLSLAARRLHASELPWLQSAQLDASLVDGQLSVSRFDVGVAQGHAVGSASVDLRDRPLHAAVDLSLRGARLEQLLHEPPGKERIGGALQGQAQLKASAESIEALRASASGSLSLSLVDGSISSLLDAEIGLQGGRIVRSFLSGAEPIAIHCAVAAIELSRGAGRIRTLVVDTERTRTVGSGTIDLARETVDLVLTPAAKQPGLFVLARSIRLHGPLRQPARELVARAEPSAEPARGCPAARP